MRTKEIYHKNTDLSNTSDPLTVTKEHRPSYWAVLPAQVRYDPALPASAKILYAEISSLTDQTGYCYASNAYFISLYGITDRTLQRQLKALEKKGYIRILDGAGGSDLRKIFAGINPLTLPPDKNVGGPPTKMSPPPDKNVGDNSKENSKENNPPSSPPRGTRKSSSSEFLSEPAWKPDRFAGFWNFYPVHKSKRAAVKAWDRLKPSDELIARMGKALARQKQSEEWTRDDARIPYAATWLNNARWEDEDVQPLPPQRAEPFLSGEVRW